MVQTDSSESYMSLWSALWPSDHVVQSLLEYLEKFDRDDDGLTWSTPKLWHITLGYYGKDDSVTRMRWLRERLADQAAPTVCFEGAGTFPQVLWVKVFGDCLAKLAEAARPARNDYDYRAHMTLARCQEGIPPHWLDRLADYRSEPWLASEVLLMRTDNTPEGKIETVLDRIPLKTAASMGNKTT